MHHKKPACSRILHPVRPDYVFSFNFRKKNHQKTLPHPSSNQVLRLYSSLQEASKQRRVVGALAQVAPSQGCRSHRDSSGGSMGAAKCTFEEIDLRAILIFIKIQILMKSRFQVLLDSYIERGTMPTRSLGTLTSISKVKITPLSPTELCRFTIKRVRILGSTFFCASFMISLKIINIVLGGKGAEVVIFFHGKNERYQM